MFLIQSQKNRKFLLILLAFIILFSSITSSTVEVYANPALIVNGITMSATMVAVLSICNALGYYPASNEDELTFAEGVYAGLNSVGKSYVDTLANDVLVAGAVSNMVVKLSQDVVDSFVGLFSENEFNGNYKPVNTRDNRLVIPASELTNIPIGQAVYFNPKEKELPEYDTIADLFPMFYVRQYKESASTYGDGYLSTSNAYYTAWQYPTMYNNQVPILKTNPQLWKDPAYQDTKRIPGVCAIKRTNTWEWYLYFDTYNQETLKWTNIDGYISSYGDLVNALGTGYIGSKRITSKSTDGWTSEFILMNKRDVESSQFALINTALGHMFYPQDTIAKPATGIAMDTNRTRYTTAPSLPINLPNVSSTGEVTMPYEQPLSTSIPADVANSIPANVPMTLNQAMAYPATVTIPNTATGNAQVDKLRVETELLKSRFPFSIPFDLMKGFAILKAEPVAPKFTFPIVFNRLGINESYTIDLNMFSGVAAIGRWFLSFLFVLMMIIATKRLIS